MASDFCVLSRWAIDFTGERLGRAIELLSIFSPERTIVHKVQIPLSRSPRSHKRAIELLCAPSIGLSIEGASDRILSFLCHIFRGYQHAPLPGVRSTRH
ncbi:hypothetical protein [Microcoleus sp. BROC3]|uniref:hypothetical protein n=1 Tax=Microcoleus sp. BROC3 TaxID=3055323 RepID=UPI002FD222CE